MSNLFVTVGRIIKTMYFSNLVMTVFCCFEYILYRCLCIRMSLSYVIISVNLFSENTCHVWKSVAMTYYAYTCMILGVRIRILNAACVWIRVGRVSQGWFLFSAPGSGHPRCCGHYCGLLPVWGSTFIVPGVCAQPHHLRLQVSMVFSESQSLSIVSCCAAA